MKAVPRWVPWVLLGLAQLAVPLSMIWLKETVLSEGTEFRLKLRPFDPADPFRGRYLALRFEVEDRDYALPPPTSNNIYARLETRADGFAVIAEITTNPSLPGALRVERARWSQSRIAIPWNRFFVNEKRAPILEEEVRKAMAARTGPPVYATLRVANGDAVITGLWIGQRKLQ